MTLTSKDRRNPYVGPRAFEYGETLYGRDREIQDLVNQLIAERIVLFYSPSGAGKTSLIQAALIGKMRDEGFRVLPVMRPGLEPPPDAPADANRYLLSVLLSLKEGLSPEEQAHLADLDLAHLRLAEVLERLGPGAEQSGNEVLIFDQFEEILTLDPTDEEAKEIFFEQVGEVLTPKHRWAVFAMREEHVAGLDPYLRAIPTRLRSTFRLELMGREAAQQAVQMPAEKVDVTFTDAAAEQLVKDLSTIYREYDGKPQTGLYVEPVQLQVVCQRLWVAHPGDTLEINEYHLKTIGDVSRVLADFYAEQVAAVAQATAVPERSIREWVQNHLITEQGFRGQVWLRPRQTQGLDNRVIRALVKTHLVREDTRGTLTWCELAHDRLVLPVRENNEAWFKTNLSTFQLQAELWDRRDKPDGLLLTGRELDNARQWTISHQDQLTDVEKEFLRRCLNKRRHSRLFLALALGAIIIGLVAIIASLVADHKAQMARAGTLASAALSQLQLDPERSILLALEAVNGAKTVGDDTVAIITLTGIRWLYESNPFNKNIIVSKPPRGTEYLRLVAENALDRATCTSRVKLTLTDAPLSAAHRDKVLQVLFSPDGARLATVSLDDMVKIWDAATGRMLHALPHEKKVLRAAFNRNGSLLATACDDKTAKIWGVDRGKIIHILPHDEKVSQISFDQQGTCLATAELGENAKVKLWKAGTFELMHALKHPFFMDLAFSPDGRSLATAGYKGEVKIWEVSSGKELLRLEHGDTLSKIFFSPDGAHLATMSKNNLVKIWEVPSGKELKSFKNTGEACAFSPDGKRLALVSSNDYTVYVLHFDNNRIYVETELLGHFNTVFKLVFVSQNEDLGRFLATCSADGTANLWDIVSGRELISLAGHNMPIQDMAVSQDGERLATASWDGQVKVWGIHVGHTSFVTAVAFDDKGARLATASADGTAREWNTATGQEVVPPLKGHQGNVETVAFTPDGMRLVTGGSDGTLKFWNADNGKFINSIGTQEITKAPVTRVNNIAFSPHGKFLGVLLGFSSFDANIFLMESSKEPRLLERQAYRCFAFSPDEKQMATGLDDGRILVWDVDRGFKQKELLGHQEMVFSVAYNPKKDLLATGSLDRTIKLWDTKTWERKAEFTFEDWAESIAFSPDGKLLAAGFSDRTARVFNLQGKELYAFSHPAPIPRVAFSPDGKKLATACYDGRWYLHYLDLEETIAWAKKMVTRKPPKLTVVECVKFRVPRPNLYLEQ